MSAGRRMSLRITITLVLSIVCLAGLQGGLVVVSLAEEQEMPNQPGLTPYTPRKIEWLALTVNAQLQHERHAEDLYEVFVVQAGHETLEILIQDHLGQSSRHRGTTKLEIMKSQIKTTRELIMAPAKRYGWENWVRIREPVEVSPR